MDRSIKIKSPPFWQKVLGNVSLIVTTLVLVIVFAVNGIANIPGLGKKIGFANSTAQVSNEFYLQITPAGYTFAIWGVIYAWQVLWLLYAWSFVFRPSAPRTISWIALLLYTLNNVGNVVWLYVWANSLGQVSFAVIVLAWLLLVGAIGVQSYHVYKITPVLQSQPKYKIDLWITRLLVTNGLVVYATWLTVATHINLGVVLQYFAGVASGTTGTIVLWVLSLVVLGYFALENTILDPYTRFIFMVYPVLIWALTGVLSAHWGKETPNTNPLLTAMLLVLAVVLFLARALLVVLFALFRPLAPITNYARFM